MNTPNLFSIATKELSQDAFFTWLISFADEKYEEHLLNQCAREFIMEMIKTKYSSFNETIKNVDAKRQWKNIDIIVTINNKYFVVIEDKTYTRQHDKQLYRYKVNAEKHCKERNLLEPVLIYLKTGNESLSSLNHVINEEYVVFDRPKILSIINKYSSIKNDIFNDFFINLSDINNRYNKFIEKNIREWKGNDWEGFYMLIEKSLKLDDINWGFANNPNGGFWWCCFSWLDWKYHCSIYMQLEQYKNRLCFKVETDSNMEESRADVRNELYRAIVNKARKSGLIGIKKPERFGSGAYMTFAVVEQENWLGDGIINVAKVIENIHNYQNFFTEFHKELM
ncbi:PD-(D/E)XK nuclease family protein [Ursidibacter maritimus]|uniref:PD-(D/E)XK nuclease family protein n=4 Tax=Ursidibacter maritimus TaxID=1331689 RepID=A0A949T4E6_9PAST|nr:hypothetical protein A1D26_08455 [Ursidibacter maritimus]MBV6524815.1 PD-(D/E)XK nuclease family protein [Ursidibacter maritimus]MBV6526190.1 PD-(D/E)XK nuclease family protein [Ursidibacter maritimus]MBV6528269.1 PD-(D/E)XK nuclease family protein [Ursidibacter maritimus]MBV6529691.1 PD-(D/E)XK nuclease family protein [Ursidibacter maritimus]